PTKPSPPSLHDARSDLAVVAGGGGWAAGARGHQRPREFGGRGPGVAAPLPPRGGAGSSSPRPWTRTRRGDAGPGASAPAGRGGADRKSTRLNSSHVKIS